MRLFFAYLLVSSVLLVLVDPSFLVYFALVYPLPRILKGRNYLLSVLLYVLIEEAIAYYLGGGLHGEAKSLLHDYVRSVPIFLVHFYLRQRSKLELSCSHESIFYAAGLHGVVRELIYPRVFDPLAIVLLLPHAIYIYGAPTFIELRRGSKDCKLLMRRFRILAIETIIGIFLAIMFP